MSAPRDASLGPARSSPRVLVILLRAVGAVVLLGGAIAIVGPSRLAQHLRSVSPGWFVLALACGILSNVASAWRWSRLGGHLGLRAPLGPLLLAYAQGTAVNLFLPGATLGGDALRSIQLSRLGNPLGRSSLSVVLDRVSGLWMLCALSLLALLGVAAGALLGVEAAVAALDAATGGIGAAPLAAYGAFLLLAVLAPVAALSRPASEPVAGRSSWAERMVGAHRAVVSQVPALVRSLPDSLLVQLLSALALWLAVRATGADTAILSVLAVAAPIFLAAALPISVAGFGPRELVAGAVFVGIGATSSVGVAAALLYGFTAVFQGVLSTPLLVFHRPDVVGGDS